MPLPYEEGSDRRVGKTKGYVPTAATAPEMFFLIFFIAAETGGRPRERRTPPR